LPSGVASELLFVRGAPALPTEPFKLPMLAQT
jgi:hypothetical protein